jgi:hypothetical protein
MRYEQKALWLVVSSVCSFNEQFGKLVRNRGRERTTSTRGIFIHDACQEALRDVRVPEHLRYAEDVPMGEKLERARFEDQVPEAQGVMCCPEDPRGGRSIPLTGGPRVVRRVVAAEYGIESQSNEVWKQGKHEVAPGKMRDGKEGTMWKW